MAQYKGLSFVEKEVVVTRNVPTFTFTFTETELATIMACLGSIGGSPDNSPRGEIKSFYDAMDKLVKNDELKPILSPHGLMLGHLWEDKKSSLFFKDYTDIEGWGEND